MPKQTLEHFTALWQRHTFSSGGYVGDDFKTFAMAFKAQLKQMFKECDVIGFSGGHYEGSGFIYNPQTGKYVYISYSDVRFFENEWSTNLLYRTAQHDKDWTGGRNNYCHLHNLESLVKEML